MTTSEGAAGGPALPADWSPGEAGRSGPVGPPGARVVVLCTGNAVRSVMAGFMLQYLSDQHGLGLSLSTAGTHTVDGQPVSMRTSAALRSIPEMADAPVGRHRSRQLHAEQLHHAQLVVAMEADHVRFVRRHHPVAANRTATIRRLVADLPPGPGSLNERIASLALERVAVHDDEDVADPAGREDAVYQACAEELWALTRALAPRLR